MNQGLWTTSAVEMIFPQVVQPEPQAIRNEPTTTDNVRMEDEPDHQSNQKIFTQGPWTINAGEMMFPQVVQPESQASRYEPTRMDDESDHQQQLTLPNDEEIRRGLTSTFCGLVRAAYESLEDSSMRSEIDMDPWSCARVQRYTSYYRILL